MFNRGTYDPLDERLSYSRAAGRLHGAPQQDHADNLWRCRTGEADIALAVKAIEAVSAEIERGNKTDPCRSRWAGRRMCWACSARPTRCCASTHHPQEGAVRQALRTSRMCLQRFVRAIYQPAMVLRGRSAGEVEIVTDIVTKTVARS